MKKSLAAFLSFVLVATPPIAMLSLTSGCALTVPQQDLVAKIVARRVTIEILRARPEYRTAFTASVLTIDLLLKKDGTTRADFIAAIQTLKIRELKGNGGAEIITDLLDLIDVAAGEKPWIGEGLPRLKSVLLAVNDGMASGLSLTIMADDAKALSTK